MTISPSTELFIKQLSESGHLLNQKPNQRGASENSRTPLGNTGLFCQKHNRQATIITKTIENNSQNDISINNSQNETLVNDSQDELIRNKPSRFTSRIHWLQGTFTYEDHPCMVMLVRKLEEIFKDTFEWDCGMFTRGLKYDDSAKSCSGIIVSWQRPQEFKPGHGWFSIPGSALDRLLDSDYETSLTNLFYLLQTGLCHGNEIIRRLKITRLDTTIDDFEKRMRPVDLLKIAQEGNFAGFRNRMTFCERTGKPLLPSFSTIMSPACNAAGELDYSCTLNFGSSQSDKQLCIYDKFLESNGEIDSVRWECRWSDDYAHSRFLKLAACLFGELEDETIELGALIGMYTLGSIEFVDIDSADRVSRCKRLPFWQEMIDEIGTATIHFSSPEVFIEKTVTWIEHQLSTSLATIQEIVGVDDFMSAIGRLVSSGHDRMNKTHLKMVEQGKKDKFCIHKFLDLLLEKFSSFAQA